MHSPLQVKQSAMNVGLEIIQTSLVSLRVNSAALDLILQNLSRALASHVTQAMQRPALANRCAIPVGLESIQLPMVRHLALSVMLVICSLKIWASFASDVTRGTQPMALQDILELNVLPASNTSTAATMYTKIVDQQMVDAQPHRVAAVTNAQSQSTQMVKVQRVQASA